MLQSEIPKTIEEMLGVGACGCLQVAGAGFNGLIFPQIDLRKTVERKQEKVKLGEKQENRRKGKINDQMISRP